MSKFKVGQKVRVRKDLVVGRHYDTDNDFTFDEEMAFTRGNIYTILEEDLYNDAYELDHTELDGYAFTEDMLEEVTEDSISKLKYNQIYVVSHQSDLSGKEYAFIGDSGLERGRKVLCDTSRGKQVGYILRVVDADYVIRNTKATLPLNKLEVDNRPDYSKMSREKLRKLIAKEIHELNKTHLGEGFGYEIVYNEREDRLTSANFSWVRVQNSMRFKTRVLADKFIATHGDVYKEWLNK